jgi:outer membrane protein assembly factor BamD (BamD/ComL family)
MRRVFIVLIILFVLIGSLNPISQFFVHQGLRNPQKPWAPGLAATGTHMQLYMMQYRQARQNAEAVLQSFPTYRRADRLVYCVALCYEKEGNVALTTADRDAQYRRALEWYAIFLTRWPKHRWATSVRRRVTTLEAGGL